MNLESFDLLGRLRPSPLLVARAAEVAGGIEGPMEKARALYAHVNREIAGTAGGWGATGVLLEKSGNRFAQDPLWTLHYGRCLLDAGRTKQALAVLDGIPEDVTDGDSALLVSPGDAEGLAVALERVLTDPELRRRLARRARETFEARFSAGAFAAALVEIYAGLGVRP